MPWPSGHSSGTWLEGRGTAGYEAFRTGNGRRKEAVYMDGIRGAIRIGAPYIEEHGDGKRLCAHASFPDGDRVLWFWTDGEYAGYLTGDRGDAFVVAVLTTAMRMDLDIVSDAPVTRRLLYQLGHYLVPMMARNMDAYHHITIRAEAADGRIPCEGAVGTGWTGGVDCMFTYLQSMEGECEPITHLLVTSNGSLEEPDNSDAVRRMAKRAEAGFGKEAGLPVVCVDTNLQDAMDEPFLAVAAFRHGAVVLALQKLFGVFLFSSAYEFSKFSFDADNSFYYDLATLGFLETDNTVFYDAGGAYSRAQKLERIAGFEPAHKYLHPCIHVFGKNCCKCSKCVRTETALYGLGVLEKFSDVFDVEAFLADRDWYIAECLAHRNSQHYGEAAVLIERSGIPITEAARRMARSIRAAQSVVERNKKMLAGRLGVRVKEGRDG